MQAIAAKYKVSKRTVARYIHKYNIPVDLKKRNALRDVCGSNNPNWKGGLPLCPVCLDTTISRQVSTCLACRDISESNNGMYGRTHTNEARVSIAKATTRRMLTKSNPMNNPVSVDKIRNKALDRIERLTGTVKPKYNLASIPIIEEYAKNHGLCFIHAENGGEVRILNFFVDGYDKSNNTVIEYYERAHFNIDGSVRSKDIIREQAILRYLDCVFIRIEAGFGGLKYVHVLLNK